MNRSDIIVDLKQEWGRSVLFYQEGIKTGVQIRRYINHEELYSPLNNITNRDIIKSANRVNLHIISVSY